MISLFLLEIKALLDLISQIRSFCFVFYPRVAFHHLQDKLITEATLWPTRPSVVCCSPPPPHHLALHLAPSLGSLNSSPLVTPQGGASTCHRLFAPALVLAWNVFASYLHGCSFISFRPLLGHPLSTLAFSDPLHLRSHFRSLLLSIFPLPCFDVLWGNFHHMLYLQVSVFVPSRR